MIASSEEVVGIIVAVELRVLACLERPNPAVAEPEGSGLAVPALPEQPEDAKARPAIAVRTGQVAVK